MNHDVCVGGHEAAGDSDYTDRWQQVLALREVHRKQPNEFLVAQNADWQVFPGHRLIGRRWIRTRMDLNLGFRLLRALRSVV